MSIDEQMDRENVNAHTDTHEILLSHNKEGSLAISDNMDGLVGHDAE